MRIVSSSSENSVCFGCESKIIFCMMRRIASPAARRRSLAVARSGMGTVVGRWMEMVTRGKSRRGCLPTVRPKNERDGPSRRTGSTVAPVLAATNAGPS